MPTAAIAAANGTGTQEIKTCQVIQHDKQEDCVSVFYNEKDVMKSTLYGTAICDIPSSGSGGTASFGGQQIFTVNNDIDVLGDIYATIRFNNSITYDVAATETDYGARAVPIAAFTRDGLLNLIQRAEFSVGMQTWHTLEKHDIQSMLRTTLDTGEFSRLLSQAEGNHTSDGIRHVRDPARLIFAGVACECTIPLPTLTKSLTPKLFDDLLAWTSHGHMLAAAPNQQVRIRLTYASAADVFKVNTGAPASDFSSAPAVKDFSFEVKLTAKQSVMMNSERRLVREVPLNKTVHATQNANATVKFVKDKPATPIDCDNFSLFTSHLLITVTNLESTFHGSSDVTSDTLGTAPVSALGTKASIDAGKEVTAVHDSTSADGLQGRYARGGIGACEVLLNSTSHTGISLSGSLMDSTAASSIGLHIPEDALGTGRHPSGCAFAVFPLAAYLYSAGSSVPLNRFDNIRVKITTNSNTIAGMDSFVNVTCVGSTTVLYDKGSGALTMY